MSFFAKKVLVNLLIEGSLSDRIIKNFGRPFLKRAKKVAFIYFELIVLRG